MGTGHHERTDESADRMWQIGPSDWVVGALVAVVTGIIGCAPLVMRLGDWLTGGPLRFSTVAVADPPPVADPLLGPGVSGVYTGQAEFLIADPSVGQWLASLLPPVGLAAATVACLWLTIGLIGDLRSQRFTGAARNRGRALSLVLFGYGLLAPVASVVSTALVTTPMRQGSFEVRFLMDHLQGWPIVVGLGLGLFVELVWRRGRFLEAETEGLV